jgi:hypothetical protein
MTLIARPAAALLIALGSLTAVAGAQSAPASPPASVGSPAPTPTPLPEDAGIDKRAKAEFLAWQSGKLDKSQYSPRLAEQATEMVVTQVSPQLQALGDFKEIKFTSAWVDQGYDNYQYLVTCSKGAMLMLYAVSTDGKVAGVRFRQLP